MRVLLRALMWLAPRDFRGRYGGAIQAFYEERLLEGRGRSRVVTDLLFTIAIEWGRIIGSTYTPSAFERHLTRGERVRIFVQEFLHAGRSLRKNAGFTAAAVITLALGLASTTAIFSIVDTVLLQPLPFRESDRVVIPESKEIGAAQGSTSVSYADFMDWRDNGVFEFVSAYQQTNMDLTGAGDPVRVAAAAVGRQFFDVLGVPAARGRLLENYDYPLDAPRAVVISDRFWRSQFGARPDIVGTEIVLNGIKRPIVGVMPEKARWPLTADVWVPQRFTTEQDPDLQRRDNFIFESIARLKPGTSLENTRADMGRLAARIAAEQPRIRKNVTMEPTPILQSLLGPTTPRALWILLGAVALLLLIACVNVANLQLARAATRQRELAVRTALGASRYRLVRQTLVESAMLGLAGGAIGIVGAHWMVKALVAAAPAGVPRIELASLNLPAVAFATGISLLVALFFGLAPAAQASRSDPSQAMSAGSVRTQGSRGASRTRRMLVLSELALSAVLLVGAGLALRSIQNLRAVQPGFDAPSVLTASISLPGARYRTTTDVVRMFYGLRDRLAAAPGIRAAGLTSASPLGSGGFYLGRSMAPDGKPPTRENEISVNWNVATPGYFAALGMPIRGRDFTTFDDSASTPVMIVNEAFAKQMFGDADPIGKRAMSTRDEKVYRQIVGVVPNVKFYGNRDTTRALVYVPYAQNPWGIGIITVRTVGDPLAAVGTVRRELAAIDPNIALAQVTTMEQAAARSIASDSMVAELLGAFAALALILAAVGIFGVLSYTVAQRTQELGVRMALGAQRGDVLALVLRETAPLVAAGIAVGLGIGFGVTRLMRAILFEVGPTDPVTFVGVPIVLAVVGLLAALMPARRAAKVDPLIALRSD
jgi:putative ABC transport system permease protein